MRKINSSKFKKPSNAYPPPEVAIAAEIHFDFLAKQGHIQGEIADQLHEYSFELGVPNV